MRSRKQMYPRCAKTTPLYCIDVSKVSLQEQYGEAHLLITSTQSRPSSRAVVCNAKSLSCQFVHPKCAKTSPSYVFSWCISMFPMWVCTCAYYITTVPPPLPRCGLQCEVYVIRSYWCSSLLVIIVSNVSLQLQCLLHHRSPAPSSPLRFAMCALRLETAWS